MAEKSGSRIVFATVIALIIVLAGTAYFVFGTQSNDPLTKYLYSNKTINMGTLEAIISARVNATPSFALTYMGGAIEWVRSGVTITTLTFTTNSNLSKNGSLLLDNGSVTTYAYGSGGSQTSTYVLRNGSQVTYCGVYLLSSVPGSVKCINSNVAPITNKIYSQTELLNEYLLGQLAKPISLQNVSFTISSIRQASRLSNQCIFVSGTIKGATTIALNYRGQLYNVTNYTTETLSGNYSACLSNTFYLPLNVSMNLSLSIHYPARNISARIANNYTATAASRNSSASILASLPASLISAGDFLAGAGDCNSYYYGSCSTAVMNTTGYLRVNYTNPTRGFGSQYAARILGLACLANRTTSPTQQLFTPVNIIVQNYQYYPTKLYFNCGGNYRFGDKKIWYLYLYRCAPYGSTGAGNLGIAYLGNATAYASTTLPLGSNQNTGPVSPLPNSNTTVCIQ